MSSNILDTIASRAQPEGCPFLELPGEIRNSIYEYAFLVDHIQGIQYKAPAAGKTNNEYDTLTSKYTMIFETRDTGNWRSVPQQLSTLLALQQTCRQINTETELLPFCENVFDVGLHAIQHFVAMVPRRILNGVKVISLWKRPGHTMDQVGDMFLAPHQDQNNQRIWMTQLRMLKALPALEKVFLNVRGGVESMGLGLNWEQELKRFIETVHQRVTGNTVEVEMV